ncbi:putative defensin-like protein 63 [Arabidopsis thaliana]
MDIRKTYVTIFFVGILTISYFSYNSLAKPAIQQEQEPHCIGPCEIAYGNRPCNEECTSQQYAYGFCDYQTKGEDNPQCCCYTS